MEEQVRRAVDNLQERMTVLLEPLQRNEAAVQQALSEMREVHEHAARAKRIVEQQVRRGGTREVFRKLAGSARLGADGGAADCDVFMEQIETTPPFLGTAPSSRSTLQSESPNFECRHAWLL